MNVAFEFAAASRVIFGCGAAREVAKKVNALGRNALVATGRTPGRAALILDDLRAAGIACEVFPIDGEPTVEAVRSGVARAKEKHADVVVSIGGGSAIDAGKAIAALLTNSGDPLDYLEVIGAGRALVNQSAPFVAVPTTAGTGSESTRNAVLASPEHRVKASLRSPGMLPRLAVIDPELTFDLPPAITASTGLDALTQLIEPYASARANALTDVLCLEGMRRAARSLARACEDGSDREARTEMAFASLLGGMALANAGLGVVHGFAAPIGGMFPAPHGAVCAALLPHGMEANIRALRARAPESDALRRYGTIAAVLTGDPNATPEDGVRWAAQTCRLLRIPPLRAYGIAKSDLPALVENAARASSMKANPITLTEVELSETIARAL